MLFGLFGGDDDGPRCRVHDVPMVRRCTGLSMYLGCPICDRRSGAGVDLPAKGPRRVYNADGTRPAGAYARLPHEGGVRVNRK
jgi:hypothetical protein